MSNKLLRGFLFALPVSLGLWTALGLATVLIIDHHRPGFRHSVKVRIVRLTGRELM